VVTCGKVRYSILSIVQCVAGAVGVCCSAGGPSGDIHVCCSVVQCGQVRYSILSVLKCVALWCSVLQVLSVCVTVLAGLLETHLCCSVV